MLASISALIIVQHYSIANINANDDVDYSANKSKKKKVESTE